MNETFNEIRKFTCPEILFGIDSRKAAGKKVRKFGVDKIMLVTSASVKSQPWFKDIVQSFHVAGVKFEIFTVAGRDPGDTHVADGADLYAREHCRGIVAVGGGSVIDCAKSMGVVITNGKHIQHYKGIDTINTPMPPLICLPTTAGTATDVSQYATIYDTVNKNKFVMISKLLIPDVSILDPVTLLTLPPQNCVSNGFETFCLAVEAYVSNISSPLTDSFALDALAGIDKYFLRSLEDSKDIEVRAWLMMSSLKAGIAYSNASVGINHSMAHTLSGMTDASYGQCSALLCPHTIAYNAEVVAQKYSEICKRLVVHGSSNLAEYARMMVERTSILNAVTASEWPEVSVLAEKAIAYPCNATSPRTPCAADIEVLFTKAFGR